MPADLEAIVAGAREPSSIPVSRHYSMDRVGREDRPSPDDIRWGLQESELAITSDDRGAGDDRGAVCTVVCRSRRGRRMAVRINYEKSPMLVVTAYWMSRDA